MYPRKPLSHAEQIIRMKSLVRRLNNEASHRYNELFASTKGRRDCPFEVRLRSKLAHETRNIAVLAEACLKELKRQEAMFLAPFKPGDRIASEYTRDDGTKVISHYLIIDIVPYGRNKFYYDALPLTKSGMAHKGRGPYGVSDDSQRSFKLSQLPVCEEAEEEAKYWREVAKVSRELSFVLGELDQYEVSRDYLGSPSYRRQNRLSVEKT